MDKKGLVPKLRFPEFRKASSWTKRRLADEGEVIRGLTYTSTDVKETGLPVLRSSNIQCGRLLLDDDIVHVGVECAPNMLLRADDLVVCMSNGSKPLVGKNAVYEPTDLRIRTVGAFCAIYRSTNTYARLLFSSPTYQTYVLDSIAGGNINNLTPNQLGSFAFPFPSDASEQRKIAECLQSLDELIAAETEKLEALKRHKKGLLQQLFPAEGETTPRLRFPEFCNLEPWCEHELAELVQFSSGGTPSKANPKFWNGDIPWISAEAMHVLRVSDSFVRVTDLALQSGLAMAPRGSLLILTRGSMLFRRVPLCITERDVAFNQDVKCMLPKNVNAEFLLYALISKEPRIPIDQTGIGAGKI